MSRSRTVIRRMWADGNGLGSLMSQPKRVYRGPYDQHWTRKGQAVLVVPDNPAAREAMIQRTVDTLWPHLSCEGHMDKRELVEQVLATALYPTSRKDRRR